GNRLEEYNPEAIAQPIRMQGQHHDRETGLFYNRYRYYQPTAGRYLTQDPVGLSGGANIYLYPSNPIQWIDPRGLTPVPTDQEDFAGAGGRIDSIINNTVSQYNTSHGFTSTDPEYLNPDTIRAQIRTETGCIKKAREQDSMQVNNKGDWDIAKTKLGLKEGSPPGQDLGIQAGVGWLTQKKLTSAISMGTRPLSDGIRVSSDTMAAATPII
ncbi:MAG: RHS repeat-associated core domain-containing protein, partial [Curvibacter sp.]|nr:RHS repeat-associated core domain-containing protein [Curvibacter sp.]